MLLLERLGKSLMKILASPGLTWTVATASKCSLRQGDLPFEREGHCARSLDCRDPPVGLSLLLLLAKDLEQTPKHCPSQRFFLLATLGPPVTPGQQPLAAGLNPLKLSTGSVKTGLGLFGFASRGA